MDDWLSELDPGHRVLDLASASGSFSTADLCCSVITIDEDRDAFRATGQGGPERVIGSAEHIPLASLSIDLVVCNHALEHLTDLDSSLAEIRRVLKSTGRVYIAVPDGYGLCDGLYRWVFEGGGHVNRFRRLDLVRLIESRLGVRLVRWQRLYSSFTYLRGIPELREAEELQPRLKKIARMPRTFVRAAQTVLYLGTRAVDRFFRTTLSTYGWALWFDREAGSPRESPAYVNVCLHCGTGHPAEPAPRLPRRRWLCLSCGAQNPFWFLRL